MKYAVCTSFSPAGYEFYGRVFVRSYLQHWPDAVPLHIVHEGAHPGTTPPGRVVLHDLRDDKECWEFAEQAPKVDPRAGTDHHLWGAVKWSKKVFALSGLAPKLDVDWLIWIDGDVDTYQDVSLKWLSKILPEGKALSFLARPHWRYSECGFVGYRLSDPRVRTLLERMRKMYTSLEVFKLAERGDSYVFDWCRRPLFRPEDYHDLTVDGRSAEQQGRHVWPKSPLGECMFHHKGPRRKGMRYGPQTHQPQQM